MAGIHGSGDVGVSLIGGLGENVADAATTGNNGTFSAKPGWDPCTGLGSPIGSAIASALTGKAAAH